MFPMELDRLSDHQFRRWFCSFKPDYVRCIGHKMKLCQPEGSEAGQSMGLPVFYDFRQCRAARREQVL